MPVTDDHPLRAAILGYGTIALAIGIISSAAFAAKTV